jgi:hypothetical protein
MTIENEINRPTANVFRRAAIRRRNTSDGLYEEHWLDITEYVKSWGHFKRAVDDLRLNRFTHSGVNLTVRNDTGAFNKESNQASLWNGYLTRYRSLVRIQGGYVDDAGNELPTETSLGVFIMTDEIPINGYDNDVDLQCRSIASVFDEVRAEEIAGLGAPQTASDLITKIRDHTDGAGSFVFRQFISTGAWTIQTTTTEYNLATSASFYISSMSAWDLMIKLAECEGYLLLINRTGGLEFRDRSERASTAAFDFYGQGFPLQNIIRLDEYKEAIDKYFSFFRLKYKTEDTTTSYVSAGTATTVDPSNTAWKYGNQTYDFENNFFATSTAAQTVVNNLASTFGTVRDEIKMRTKFVPHLEISDKVSVSYRSYDITGQTIWDLFNWDEADWAAGGENFDLNSVGYKVLSLDTNLDNFTTQITLREI